MVTKLRVGGFAVGLVGLEAALRGLEESLGKDAEGARCGIPPGEAARRLLAVLETRNYIPPSKRDAYLEALERLWKERAGMPEEVGDPGGRPGEPDVLAIRILGPGCPSCDRLEAMVTSAMQRLGMAADIEHVRELDEIWRYGVMGTPALVINGKVLCSGRLPSPAQVEQWVREAAAPRDG